MTTTTATTQNLPAYPCDHCGHNVQTGERVHITDNGLTVEHADCAKDWFRRNFGREGLS